MQQCGVPCRRRYDRTEGLNQCDQGLTRTSIAEESCGTEMPRNVGTAHVKESSFAFVPFRDDEQFDRKSNASE